MKSLKLLPASEPATVRQTPAAGQSCAGHASLRHTPELILVVDDDANVRASLGEVLTQEHYAVKLACDGRDAVRQFLDGPPDLIVLDVNMPDITGWQAFRIMTELYPFVPVIVMTARPGQIRRAAELGVDMLLEKPLHIPTLLDSVRRLLSRTSVAEFSKLLHTRRTHDLPGTQD